MADRPAISRTQSEELDEAASSLLHLSLEIHLPPPTTVASASSRSPSSHHPQSNTELRNKRRRSLEDLRIPPGYSTITASSRAAKQEDAASTRSANSGDLSSTHDDGGVAGGSSTIPRSPRDDSSGGTGPRGKGRGRTSETHPFAGSPHLLRRASSFETELIREPEEAEDSEEGFTSDEEPFRVRPPSIASSSTSQRSSPFGVRLEDRSECATDVFARDVKINGFHPVGPQSSGGFVVFDITIKTREGTMIQAHKRYSAFVHLRSELIAAFPHLKPLIPQLPPKSSLCSLPMTPDSFILAHQHSLLQPNSDRRSSNEDDSNCLGGSRQSYFTPRLGLVRR